VYKWTPSLTLNNDKISNPVATPSRSTTYYVIVTNNNNCTSRDSVKVTVLAKPTVKSARDTTICNGSSVVLQPQITHASVINWSPAIGLNKTNVANPTASPSSNTTYTITAANGVCIAAEKIIVSVMPLPVTTVTNDTSICNNIPLQLQATGGEKYVWQPADYLSDVTIANPVALPPKNITYQVKVTGANGCERLDSVAIAIKPLPVLSVNPTSASICSGDTITISASGGDTYLWSPAATVAQPTSANSAVFPKNNTTYSILVSENICNTVDTVYTSVTVNPAITVSVTKSNDIDCNIGESRLNATGGTAYKWYPQTGLSDPNVSNPIATPSQTTQYHVKVFNGNGCEKEDSVEVKVLGESGQASYLMPTAFTPNNDGLNDYFGVKKWGNISNFELNVYDRWGKLIFFTRNSSNDWDGTYRGQLQPTGTYVYQVKAKTLCGTIYKKGTVTLIK
jgi:gliding motility-associated-like protein